MIMDGAWHSNSGYDDVPKHTARLLTNFELMLAQLYVMMRHIEDDYEDDYDYGVAILRAKLLSETGSFILTLLCEMFDSVKAGFFIQSAQNILSIYLTTGEIIK